MVNSSLGADGGTLTHHASHDIGVAVATTNGLVVPTIKVHPHSNTVSTSQQRVAAQGVQHKSLVELAQELVQLQAAAAANKLPPQALAGGTITVSNIGAHTMCLG